MTWLRGLRGLRGCLILVFISSVTFFLLVLLKTEIDVRFVHKPFFERRQRNGDTGFQIFSVSLEPKPTPWKPRNRDVSRVLQYLNITKEQALSRLPLTLDSRFLLSNTSLCKTQDGKPVDILFFVHTAPLHFAQRQKMRATYTAAKHFLPYDFRVRRIFLLGTVQNGTHQRQLEEEHRLHGDLVQGDFLDSYHNLSHKGVMGYRWVSKFCPSARIIVKTDDDVFFDTFKLIHRYWAEVKDKKRAIFCSVWKNKTMAILRKGKWTVSERLFASLKVYPYDYCSGMTVLFTGDLMPALYTAARFTPVFWIDDIYLFGMLPKIASNVTYYDVGYGNGVMDLNVTRGLKCMKDKGHNCQLLASAARGEQIDAMWNVSLKLHSLKHWHLPSVRV